MTKSETKPRKPRATPPAPSTNGSAARPRKNALLARDVAAELNALRTTLEEMTEHFRLRAGAQISELMLSVEGDPAVGRKGGLSVSVLEQLKEALQEVRLKPRKGRARDFVKLQTLLEELVALLPAER